VKKTVQDPVAHEKRIAPEDDTEEVVVPGISAFVGILLTGLLYLVLPSNITLGPNWLLLGLELVFVVPLLIDILTSWDLSHMARRILTLAPLVVSTLALVSGVALFTFSLPTNTNATNLLRGAALLWLFNILVFALWYWEIDGGGPWRRHRAGHLAVDLLFPQQVNGKRWAPDFLDYLFVAFTSATAFSPTDTFPLTKKAKMLMMAEAIISLTVIAIIAARAVNILGK
jgi:hypothetical protein